MKNDRSFIRWTYISGVSFALALSILGGLYVYRRWCLVPQVALARSTAIQAVPPAPQESSAATLLETIAENLPDNVRIERFEYRLGQVGELIIDAQTAFALYNWYEQIKRYDHSLVLMHVATLPSGLVRGTLRQNVS